MNRNLLFLPLVALLLLASCTSQYRVSSIERDRILIDARYDAQPDAQAAEFLKPYKHIVDSIMGPVVGRSAKYMTADRPESPLSNLLTDILIWAAKDYNEKPDFAVYNMGGIRADLPKGDVTYGDVLDVAPFENKIAFITLKGSDVMLLFNNIASAGGEGVSSSVRIVARKTGKVASATINGQPVDPEKEYRVATIDYLLGGTDKMTAFLKGYHVNSPKDKMNNTRFIIMNYFREHMRQGVEVDANVEGRIIFK